MRCAYSFRNSLSCQRPTHGVSPFCWQHDPATAHLRCKVPRWGTTHAAALACIDAMSGWSCAETGLWREPW